MLVLGSRGMGGIKRAMWGLVRAARLRVRRCPALAVRRAAGGTARCHARALAALPRDQALHLSTPAGGPGQRVRLRHQEQRHQRGGPQDGAPRLRRPPEAQQRRLASAPAALRRWRGCRCALSALQRPAGPRQRHDAQTNTHSAAAQTLLRHFVEHDPETTCGSFLQPTALGSPRSLLSSSRSRLSPSRTAGLTLGRLALLALFATGLTGHVRHSAGLSQHSTTEWQSSAERGPQPAVMTVPARPCRMASASAMPPTAARPPVAAAKRQAAATLGAMLPLANDMRCSWLQGTGEGSGRCSLGQAAGS